MRSGIFSDVHANLPALDAVLSSLDDEGVDELQRIQKGGCHPVDGCQDGDPYDGAKFPFLAANVVTEAGETLFPATFVKEVGGVKVGFIGLTLEGTPSIVNPDGIRGLTFQDEADTINAAVPKLQAQGVETIIVLIHGNPVLNTVYWTEDRFDGFGQPLGPGTAAELISR